MNDEITSGLAHIGTEKLRALKLAMVALELAMLDGFAEILHDGDQYDSVVRRLAQQAWSVSVPASVKIGLGDIAQAVMPRTRGDCMRLVLLASSVSTFVGMLANEIRNRELEMIAGPAGRDLSDFS